LRREWLCCAPRWKLCVPIAAGALASRLPRQT